MRRTALKIWARRDRLAAEMLQGPVCNAVRARGLADLENPDVFRKLVRVG